MIIGEAETRAGHLALLRRDQGGLELYLDGTHLVTSTEASSEVMLARLTVDRRRITSGSREIAALVLGFGLGFTVRELLRHDGVGLVMVLELFAPLVHWLRRLPETEDLLVDPRVVTLVADAARPPLSRRMRFDLVLLDVGNGDLDPVLERNAPLYAVSGLTMQRRLLRPGGVLGAWAAHRSHAFERALSQVFGTYEVHEVPLVTGRPELEPDRVYLAVKPPRKACPTATGAGRAEGGERP